MIARKAKGKAALRGKALKEYDLEVQDSRIKPGDRLHIPATEFAGIEGRFGDCADWRAQILKCTVVKHFRGVLTVRFDGDKKDDRYDDYRGWSRFVVDASDRQRQRGQRRTTKKGNGGRWVSRPQHESSERIWQQVGNWDIR